MGVDNCVALPPDDAVTGSSAISVYQAPARLHERMLPHYGSHQKVGWRGNLGKTLRFIVKWALTVNVWNY